MNLIFDCAEVACLSHNAAAKDHPCGKCLPLLRPRAICACGRGGCQSIFLCCHLHGRGCPIHGEGPFNRAFRADDTTCTARIEANGILQTFCRSTLCHQFGAEMAGHTEADDVAVHRISRLAQRLKDRHIPRCSLPNGALPNRGESPFQINDILLKKNLRETIVLCNLCRSTCEQCSFDNLLRTNDNLPFRRLH